jgi:hypothetical protein
MAERCRAYDSKGPPGYPIRRCVLDAGHDPWPGETGHSLEPLGRIGQSKGTDHLELIEASPGPDPEAIEAHQGRLVPDVITGKMIPGTREDPTDQTARLERAKATVRELAKEADAYYRPGLPPGDPPHWVSLIREGQSFQLPPGSYLVFLAKETMSRQAYDQVMRDVAASVPEGVRWIVVPVPDVGVTAWHPDPHEIEEIANRVYDRMEQRERAGYRHPSGARIWTPDPDPVRVKADPGELGP